MKLFFKKSWKWLSAVLVVFIITMTLVLIRTDYEITIPANITPVNNFITIDLEDDEIPNLDINTVSVYSPSRISLLNYMLGKLNKYATISEISQYYNTSNQYILAQGTLDKRISIYNAIISGYEAAGYEINKVFSGHIITTVMTFCSADIEIGDILVSLGNMTLSETVSPSTALNSYYQDVDFSQNIPAIIKRSGKEYEMELEMVKVNNSYSLGIALDSYYIPSVSSDSDSPKFEYSLGNTIGPSGGLMQALYIYEYLTGGQLTKGLKIAGTGTITVTGKAGLIGGIEQKIYTAELSKVDYFFVPVDTSYANEDNQNANWIKAQEAYLKLKNPHLKIIKVSSLEDVITELEMIQNAKN